MFTKLLKEQDDQALEIKSAIPKDFLLQKNAHGFFAVTGDMVIDRLLSIKITEGIPTSDESCTMKIEFTGILSPKGNLVKMEKNSKGVPTWLRGFKSLLFEFNSDLVEKGLLKAKELEHLVNHAKWFQEVGSDAYYKMYSKTRIYLSPLEEDSKFLFDIEPRLNPKTNELVPGIIPKVWSPYKWELIGSVTPNISIGSNTSSFDEDALSLLDD